MVTCDIRSRKATTVASAELDGQYKRLRRVVAKLAHKAQWHKQRNAPIYVSAVRSRATEERLLRSQSRRVAPRGADAVGSLLRGNGGMGATR